MTPLQKLPKNVGDLGKLIVAQSFKKLPKVQKSPNLVTLTKHQIFTLIFNPEASYILFSPFQRITIWSVKNQVFKLPMIQTANLLMWPTEPFYFNNDNLFDLLKSSIEINHFVGNQFFKPV